MVAVGIADDVADDVAARFVDVEVAHNFDAIGDITINVIGSGDPGKQVGGGASFNNDVIARHVKLRCGGVGAGIAGSKYCKLAGLTRFDLLAGGGVAAGGVPGVDLVRLESSPVDFGWPARTRGVFADFFASIGN